MSTESGWQWKDDSIVQFVNWAKNQPNDWQGEEDCVDLQKNGKWNDVSCSMKLHFICEIHRSMFLLYFFFLCPCSFY